MARLPIPGQDQGTWGGILNDFLDEVHTSSGALKDGSVAGDVIANGAVAEAKLSGAVQTKLNDTQAAVAAAQQVTASTQAGTTYTLVLADAGTAIEFTSASTVTLTVPPNSTAAFPVGTIIELLQYGTGELTIASGAGVTIRSTDGLLSARTQYSTLSLRKRATNEWVLAGDLV